MDSTRLYMRLEQRHQCRKGCRSDTKLLGIQGVIQQNSRTNCTRSPGIQHHLTPDTPDIF